MEYWLSALYIVLEFYAYTLGMEAFLPRRWKKLQHWLIFSAWAAAMYILIYIVPPLPGNWALVQSLLTILLGGILLYRSKQPIYYLALTLIDYLIIYFCTFIASFIAAQTLGIAIYAVRETYLPSVLSALLSRTLCIFLMSMLKRCCSPTHNQSTRWPYLVIATLFPLSSFFVLLTFLSILRSSPTEPGFILPCSVLLVLSDVSVLILLDQIEQSEGNRQKTLTLEQRLQLQGESFSELSKLYAENRKAAHDFRAHLDLLSSLLESNETSEAALYLNKIRAKQTTRIFLVNCHHTVLDALLNQKARLAQEKGISIQFKVNDLSSLTIDPTDITVILSNLLDNAIEACEKCPDKQIEVMVLLENSFFFSIRNTSVPVHIVNNHIASTKVNPALHGFGLENVKTLLKKHNGEYVMLYENGWFQFSAEIPTDTFS